MIFALIDEARRRLGTFAGTAGLGPAESPSRTVAAFPGARLRAYHAPEARGPPVLIVAAPFKRPYVWDLMPEVSAVRRCLERGLRVYLLEWTDPDGADIGLDDCAARLPMAALDAVAGETGGARAILAGHSLGGTFAAICATLAPERLCGLVLLEAPLAFGAEGGPLARAAAAGPGAPLAAGGGAPLAGSAIDLLAVAAVPDEFVWRPRADLALSLADPLALAVHLRVVRWALDERAMPARLFAEVVGRLYREDRLRHGTLELGGLRTGLGRLSVPTLAVVAPAGRVVPPGSVRAGLAAAPRAPARVLEHAEAGGAALPHLAPLVAPAAHRRLWPAILDWIETST
jgi:polyhydroxyalkanoate synthase